MHERRPSSYSRWCLLNDVWHVSLAYGMPLANNKGPMYNFHTESKARPVVVHVQYQALAAHSSD